MSRSAPDQLEVADAPADQPTPVASTESELPPREDGIVIRMVSGSIRLIGGTSVFVGGIALGSLGYLGIPRGAADKMVGGQARTMHAVTGSVDKVTAATLRGIGRGGRTLAGGTGGALAGAAKGGRNGARKAWRR